MTLFDRAVEEAGRRSALLRGNVDGWKAEAAANVNGQGIHASQSVALAAQMEELLDRQAKLLVQLAPTLPAQQFAEVHANLLSEVVASNGLWRVFRDALAQRRDPTLGPILDAADLVSADCYRTCLERARDWGLVKEDQFREPPLVYFDAAASPATAQRGEPFETLNAGIRRYRSLQLPIPVVTLPYDNATCFWLLCALHHEVGHDVDQDLRLRRGLHEKLEARLHADGAPDEHVQTWLRWTAEILADGIGVVLGGAGFVSTMLDLLVLLAPLLPEPDGKDQHPHPWLRVRMLAAMLRQTGVPQFVTAADGASALWETTANPAWAEPYVPEVAGVAQTVMCEALDSLGGHAIVDLAIGLADDATRTADLARYLRTGFKYVDPNTPTRFPWRLVPAAARLALVALAPPDWQNATATAAYHQRVERLQVDSLMYIGSIRRPEKMAGDGISKARLEFLRGLARAVDFNEQEDDLVG